MEYVHGQCEQWHNSDYRKHKSHLILHYQQKKLVSSIQHIIFMNYRI
jgi:hypothetical protein